MAKTSYPISQRLIKKDQVLERRLVDLKITGRELSHTRANNLEVIDRLLTNDANITFSISCVSEAVESGKLDRNSVLEMISDITKCSSDADFSSGLGYISPKATTRGLKRAGTLILQTAKHGGTVAFGTGHPGSLLQFYLALAQMVREWGGRVARPSGNGKLTDRLHLDFVGDVAVASDTCSMPHTHQDIFMERFLETYKGTIDLVVADHGYVGPAVNRGIPVVGVMDTNDPGIAVAKALGADITIIPMNDNRPNHVLEEAARVMRQMFV